MSDDQPPWAGIGLGLPVHDLGAGTPVVAVARAAEAAGLDHVWVPDHLVAPGRVPVLDALVTLAHVAGATERIGLGLASLRPALRPLAVLAKALSTLAVLAPDRLLLGVTAAAGDADRRAARVPQADADAVLDEILDVLPPLLAGGLVDHAGHQIVEVDGLAPVPATLPPVLVAGDDEAGLRRAGTRGDAVLLSGVEPRDAAAAVAAVRAAADGAGRPAPGAVLVAPAHVADDAAVARTTALDHLTRRAGGRPVPGDGVLAGRVEDVAARLVDYADAGIDGVVLVPAHPAPLEQVAAIAAVRDLLVAADG